ncbi:MAG: aldolase/citrate lyase family protein [Planctomycetota bacterium]|nr:aldolase/citrate lyase family protein [Planctomycetota bacterium]
MRKSKALARFRKNQTVRMCCLGHYIPAFIKHAAHFGFDCIWLDMEHRDFGSRDIQAILAYSHLHDIDIMVRPPTLEKTGLYRFLEDGAAGLMIPHVNTAERAKFLVDALKFPPLGDRGLDAAGLDADFALVPPYEFAEHANAETFLVVQIETHEAVENIEAIAAVPGVDAIFVGPGDLGLRIHHKPGVMTLDAAFERVAKACKKHGKQWGCPSGTPEVLKQRYAQGGRLLNYGGDFLSILTGMQDNVLAFEGLD